MLSQLAASSSGFHPNHSNIIVEKRMKQSDRIRSATDASDQTIRQAVLLLKNLRPGLAPNDTLKVTHHPWIRMRSQRTSQQVISVGNIGHPIPQCFVNR